MTTDETTETRAGAERALAEAWGAPARLGEGAALADRDHVLRFPVLEGPPDAPRSVVVKRARTWGDAYDPDTTDEWNPAWLLLSEWAGLRLLAGAAGDLGLAPAPLAGDRARGIVVLEDLGDGERPDQLLLGDDAGRAEAILVELAARLGAMHARTIGREAEHAAICAELGRRPAAAPTRAVTLGVAVRATIDLLGIAAPAGLDEDLARVEAAIGEPGPFLAYTHGDPCPDNWLRAGGALRLLDFERGAFRHALLDGVYGRIHFPTCWCVNRLPAALPVAMEDAYRAALVEGCPEASDDRLFGEAVVAACAYWAIDLCDWVIERPAWYAEPRVLARDRRWGISTVRQRALMRFDLLAQAAGERGYLEALGATFARLAARLRAEWPASADAMPYYPAFRAGQGQPAQ